MEIDFWYGKIKNIIKVDLLIHLKNERYNFVLLMDLNFFNIKNDLLYSNDSMKDTNNNLYEVYFNQGKIMDKNNNEEWIQYNFK